MFLKVKPFDLQEAINGAELITRDGHSVRLICHDRKAGKFRGSVFKGIILIVVILFNFPLWVNVLLSLPL